MKYPEKVLLKLPDGTLARIDALGGNRSEFIRDAVEAALGGSVKDLHSAPVASSDVAKVKRSAAPKKNSLESSGKKVDIGNPTSGRSADVDVLLDAVRSKPISSRDLERRMAWLGLRYANAEKSLLASGLVRVDGGLLVIVA